MGRRANAVESDTNRLDAMDSRRGALSPRSQRHNSILDTQERKRRSLPSLSDSDHFMRRGVHQSGRGEHVPEFGPDVTIDFCRRNDIKVVIRSHQFVKEGFKVMHAGHLITVFSARDYFVDVDNAAQEKGNDAAMLLLTPDRNGDLRIHPKQVSGCRSGVAASLRNKKMQEKLDVARVLVSRGRSVFLWVITCGGEGGLRGADRRTSPMRRRQSSS